MREHTKKNPIDSWSAVNDALAVLGEAQRRVALKMILAKRQVAAIRLELTKETDADRTQIELLVTRLEEFTKANKADYSPAKSKKLDNGSVGFRASSAMLMLEGWDDGKAVTAMVKEGMLECLKTKDMVSKTALKKYSATDMATVGYHVVKGDRFSADPAPPKDLPDAAAAGKGGVN